MFRAPIAELTAHASGFDHQSNLGIWTGILHIEDNTGQSVASLIAIAKCDDRGEFSVNWKRRPDGSIKSGLGE
jgi:hypothetical protein